MKVNRPMKGCGGTDKLQRGLAGFGRTWHQEGGEVGTLQLRPGSMDRHLGSPDVSGGIYGGISRLALALTLTFILHSGITEPAASCQLPIYPHVSVGVLLPSAWDREGRKEVEMTVVSVRNFASITV